MKPHYFVGDVLEQLKQFNVEVVHFELRVDGRGMVGVGESLLVFDVSKKTTEWNSKQIKFEDLIDN